MVEKQSVQNHFQSLICPRAAGMVTVEQQCQQAQSDIAGMVRLSVCTHSGPCTVQGAGSLRRQRKEEKDKRPVPNSVEKEP